MEILKIRAKDRDVIIEYDPQEKTAYIRLAPGKVVRTIEQSPDFLLDLGRRGKLLGVEILKSHAFTRAASRNVFRLISRRYKNTLLRQIHLEAIPQLFAA